MQETKNNFSGRQWINDEYHGWICLEEKSEKEKKLREKQLENEDKIIEEFLKTMADGIREGTDPLDF